MVSRCDQHVDIIIVGAGMSGCMLALAIATLSPSLRIALIDDNSEKVEKGKHPGFDARSIALSIGSCELLDTLGLWESLVQNAQPIDDIHISDRGYLGIVELDKTVSGQPFGYVVELQNIGQLLQHQLTLTPQISRIYNSQIVEVEKQSKAIYCTLQNEEIIAAKLCVAADGASSNTAKLLSIETTLDDYACSAIIANVSTQKTHGNIAFERFTNAGPLALLPLSENRFSLVWSVGNEELAGLLALNNQDFLAQLQQAFGYRAGIFRKTGKRDSYPLKLIKSDKPITHRGVAIGNAAHCLHPVMGQGFNLGMRDLMTLATVIATTGNAGDIGTFSMLNRYWLARKKDHADTINMTNSMVTLFSNTSLPFVIGRTIALQAIACIPSLGHRIIKQAKGQFNLFIKEEKS